jgi:acyl-CoA thioester hydrolase
MTPVPHEYVVLIREHHLDTFGHVNNATYMALFEEARWDLITQNGYGLAEVQRTQKGPVILEATLRFQRELKNRCSVRIRTELVSYEGKIGKLRQLMIDEDDRVACEASFTFGLFDLAARKLISPTPEWLSAIGSRE